MKTFYIIENDKPNIIKRAINLVYNKDDEIIIQPLKSNKKTTKTIEKIKKICTKYKVNNITLCKNIRSNKEFMNNIYASNINVFDGRWLVKFLVYELAEYVVQSLNYKKENTEVSILTSQITDEAIQTIKLLVKEYKRVNIVTNNINKFKYLENKIYNDFGIMITVTNNKRKSLANSKIILNFDFEQELLNQYNIFDEAVIINLLGNIEIKKKRFNGVVINDYEIFSSRADDDFKYDRINNFFLKDLLEAKLYRKDSFANIRRNITNGHYKIKKVFGKNGGCQLGRF